MPHPKIHERIDEIAFGKSYPEVHQWIDGAFDGSNGRIHWVYRHYVQAILEHFNPTDFPDYEQRQRLISVAKLHIMFDWALYYKRIVLPWYRRDVENELASEGVYIEKKPES